MSKLAFEGESDRLPAKFYSTLEKCGLSDAIRKPLADALELHSKILLEETSSLSFLGYDDADAHLRINSLAENFKHSDLSRFCAAIPQLVSWSLQLEPSICSLIVVVRSAVAKRTRDIVETEEKEARHVILGERTPRTFLGLLKYAFDKDAARLLENDKSWFVKDSAASMVLSYQDIEAMVGPEEAAWCEKFIKAITSLHVNPPRISVCGCVNISSKSYLLVVNGIRRWSADEYNHIRTISAQRLTDIIYNIPLTIPEEVATMAQGGTLGFLILKQVYTTI